MLPADGHVHTEWSWDTARGSMERTCARAVELGLPAVAFTEHADRIGWAVLAAGEEGSRTVAFGSDAHDSAGLARGFAEAAALVEAAGFRPGRHPGDFWSCAR